MEGYQPQTIVDQPVPLLEGGFSDSSGSNSSPTSDSYAESPITIPDKRIIPPNTAQDTVSQSLNTATRRILGEFTFEQLGAIVVGAINSALGTGQITISPDGIIAKNSDGTTTFALDGTDGSATFLGELIAGSIITGAITVGANNVMIDGANKRIVINDGTNDRIIMGFLSGGF